MRIFSKTNLSLSMIAILLSLGLLSCGNQSQSISIKQGKIYTEEQIAEFNNLTSAGYDFMDEDQIDSALAKFMAAGEVIPEAKNVEYNIACVYGRTDQKDKAFEWLKKASDKGWDIPDQLYHDSDFESLVDDPRFEEIVEQCRRNSQAYESKIAEGIPEVATATMNFTTDEEFEEWINEESSKLRQHRRIWFANQYLLAKMEFAGNKFANLKEMKKADPEFDYGLERVREAASLKSPYDCWGIVSKVVLKEVDAYLMSNPSQAGMDEANYLAGFAKSVEVCDDDEEQNRRQALSESNNYLNKVTESSENYGQAQTLILANKIEMNHDNIEQFKSEVQFLLGKYNDDVIRRIVTTRFQIEAITMLFPIELHLKDINDKKVDFADYKGKALLIDFWATWCGPCRKELPNLKDAYEKYSDKGFEIVSISLDYEDKMPLDEYKKWIDENGMNWRHIYDGKDWNSELAEKYFISSIPSCFLVGPDGNIVAGGDDCRGENLETTIKEVLSL